MKVGLDATPLLGPRTGVGTYVAHLLRELVALDGAPELVATAFTGRRRVPLAEAVPAGVSVRTRRIPARVLHAAWRRFAWPSLEVVTGSVDLFHGTNFRVPPSGRAASVVTIHDLAYLRMPETVDEESLAYQKLVPRALSRGTDVCAVTEAMADEVREAYDLPPERVHVTRLGVDPSWFTSPGGASSPAPALGAERRGPTLPHLPGQYVLTVGTVEPRKNLSAVVDAYRLAAARGVDLPPLVIAGPAGWGQGLNVSGVSEGRVIMTGYLPFAELQQTVAQATVFLFPSLYEGFGLPPLEALASGVPVVASDLPVTREVLGDQAAYTDARDTEAWLRSITTALDEPVGTRDSRRARAAGFTWAHCARATLDMYELVVERHRA
jgi:glycosyltransferase involved in cell wall biosynthesis